MSRTYNLENRLIDFAVLIINLSEKLPRTPAGNFLADQLMRSGCSPAMHYGEAQSAESRKDFIHKMKIALKELRECAVCMKIINRKTWIEKALSDVALLENNELIAIFVKSVLTAEENNRIK